MTILEGKMPEKIKQKFRKIAMERFKYEKGAISKAMEEAIVNYPPAHATGGLEVRFKPD
jgi:hypothetical protein